MAEAREGHSSGRRGRPVITAHVPPTGLPSAELDVLLCLVFLPPWTFQALEGSKQETDGLNK